MASELALLDHAVLVLYLAGTVALGLAIGRRVKTGKDFFLAGRNLPWWAIGMSLVATDIGGTDIIGVGGAAYTYGMAVANFEWIGCVPAMIVAAFIFVPHFWRMGVYTIPEYMERRYNVSVRIALALCWLVFMACNLGVMLFASARMMIVTLGIDWTELSVLGWSLAGYEMLACIIGIALVAGVYTMAGGLAAVVYTDSIQCVVMIGGCLLVSLLGLQQLGGFSGLTEKVAAREAEIAQQSGELVEHNELILPVETDSPFPWPGIFFGLALVLSPAYWIGNQAIVQRSLGARSEFHAKAAYIWGALLKNIIPLVVALPGLIAFALLPTLDNGDNVFPTLATMLLPIGLRGLFLAAFLAALMSSVDSYLNAAATIFSRDLYLRIFAQTEDERSLLRVGRTTTFLLILWAIVFAWWCSRVEGTGIYVIFQTLMSFFQGPALAILLAGMFWRRATGTGAFWGFLTGVLAAISLFTLNLPMCLSFFGWQPLFRISEPFLYFSVWAFLVTMFVLVVVSLLTKPRSAEEIAPLMYQRKEGTSS